MTLETCVRVQNKTQGRSHPHERDTRREKLTVCFVCLVEDILLEVLLVFHGGVKLRVIVLKQTHAIHETVNEEICIV